LAASTQKDLQCVACGIKMEEKDDDVMEMMKYRLGLQGLAVIITVGAFAIAVLTWRKRKQRIEKKQSNQQ